MCVTPGSGIVPLQLGFIRTGVTLAQLKRLENQLGSIEGTLLDDCDFDRVSEAIQSDLSALLVKVATARIRAETRERELEKPSVSARRNGEHSGK
jgi:hypothetical protein